MIHIAICEDNAVHSDQIIKLVHACLRIDFEINTFSSGKAFLDSLSDCRCPYDLILMDIELDDPALSGIALAEKINLMNHHAQIIFISQYLKYVSTVYETKHVYFVNKGEIEIYLPRAIEKALSNLENLQNQFLRFSKSSRQYQLPMNDILFMERKLRETDIHTRSGIFTTREKLTELLPRLSPAFCLCHRSYIVNLNAVVSFDRSNITFADGQIIPVGRSYYESTKKAFAQMMMEK